MSTLSLVGTRKEHTAVLFRFDKSGEIKECTAVFPDTYGEDYAGGMTCYAHIGQHGTCSIEWYRKKTRAATPAECRALKRELEQRGYRLKIYKRLAARFTWKRKSSL